jgi:hypothetical protein
LDITEIPWVGQVPPMSPSTALQSFEEVTGNSPVLGHDLSMVGTATPPTIILDYMFSVAKKRGEKNSEDIMQLMKQHFEEIYI